jgi:hypothetical protein
MRPASEKGNYAPCCVNMQIDAGPDSIQEPRRLLGIAHSTRGRNRRRAGGETQRGETGDDALHGVLLFRPH